MATPLSSKRRADGSCSTRRGEAACSAGLPSACFPDSTEEDNWLAWRSANQMLTDWQRTYKELDRGRAVPDLLPLG